MSAWDQVKLIVPPTAPDFEKPIVEPPHTPVDIPKEDDDE